MTESNSNSNPMKPPTLDGSNGEDSDSDADGDRPRSKRPTNEVLKFMKLQSIKFDEFHKDYLEQKTMIQNVASHIKNIESSQSIAIVQSSEALKKVSVNEINIEILKQKALKSCLVFAGIPRSPDEDTIKIIIAICGFLDIAIGENDISTCYRQGHQMRVNAKGESMHPTIMAEFTRELTKTSILNAAKKVKKAKTLTSSDILSIEDLHK